MKKVWTTLALSVAVLGIAGLPNQATAQDSPAASMLTYPDLVNLAEQAELVIRARINKQATLKPERAPGLKPGYARLYIEAETIALLSGSRPVGESLKYLVDVPVDERGKVPKLKKREVLLFTRKSNGRPGEIALADPHAQLDWSPELEARLRPVLASLTAADAEPRVTGVREALSVDGNLAGESETQLFLDTATGSPVSITVVRRPGMRPVWGVSWSEIVDQAARPPQPQTLAWYRLACSLPSELPRSANLSADRAAQLRAETDYRFVIDELGACERMRSPFADNRG